MTEEQGYETHYQKGFNEGYIIAKHLPDLADSLASIESQAPRIEGFKDGRKEFALEQTREHRPSWMNPDRSNKTDKGFSKDKDIDMESEY